MAIVVVAILLVSIAPMIVLSVATRVQARRIELGTQAAWSYVDALRSETTAGPDNGVYLDLSDSDAAAEKRAKFIKDVFSKVEPPDPSASTALDNCKPTGAADDPYPYCEQTKTSSLYCVDNDDEPGCSKDSLTDMVIQSFRSTTDEDFDTLTEAQLQTDAEKGYLLSVRVYRADAFSGSEKLKSVGTDGEEGKQNTFTSGLGFRNVPLIEVTTEIPAVGGTGYSSLCERLGGCD